MAYIYATDCQVTDDVAGSAKYRQRYVLGSRSVKGLRDSVRAGLSLRVRSEAGLQSVSIPGAIADRFLAFFTGANSSNPVNADQSNVTASLVHPKATKLCRFSI